MFNPNTVAEFLALKDNEGGPCPISGMDDFWCNALRKLGMEGQNLTTMVQKHSRQESMAKARAAQKKKREDNAAKLKNDRIKAAQKADAEKQAEEAAQTV